MKRNDMSKVFNESIKQAIEDGYTINLTLYTGSYSDVEGTQVTFCRGDERMVIWIERERYYYDDEHPHRCTVKHTAYVARFTATDHECDRFYRWPSDWKEHAEAVAEFYSIDGDREDWFVEDIKEVGAAHDLRAQRYAAGRMPYATDIEVTPNMMRAINRLSGFKRTRASEITTLRRRNGKYNIVREGKNVLVTKEGIVDGSKSGVRF